MVYPQYISSLKNKHVQRMKDIFFYPEQNDRFVLVEGIVHFLDFLQSTHYTLIRIFMDESVSLQDEKFSLIDSQDITFVTKEVLGSFSDVVKCQGIIGLFYRQYDMFAVNDIDFYQPTFVLDHINDPGNLGTLIRSAVAFDRKQIILIGGAYPETGKVIRASAGMLSKIRIYRLSLHVLKEQFLLHSVFSIGMLASGVSIEILKKEQDISKAFVCLGNEARGISDELKELVDCSVSLPMSKEAESLNVAIAGSITGYLLWGSQL